MPETEIQPMSIAGRLLQFLAYGGFAPLGLGLILAAVGIVLVIRPMRTASTILVFMSLLPTIFALLALYSVATDFEQLFESRFSPKPSEVGDVACRALSYGFCGLLGTLVSVLFAVAALLRAYKIVGAVEPTTGTHWAPR